MSTAAFWGDVYCPVIDGKQSVWWTERLFKRCFYSYWEVSSSAFGIASIVFWLLALLPQIHTNWKLKSTTGISTHLILFWLVGDAMNLVGCIVLNQKMFQIVLGSYFILTDGVLLIQYFMYRKPRLAHPLTITCMEQACLLQKPFCTGGAHDAVRYYSSVEAAASFEENRQQQQLHNVNYQSTIDTKPTAKNSLYLPYFSKTGAIAMIMSAILLLTWLFVRKYSGVLSNAQSLETFGLLMGWGSGINYHLSRLPQLWHNHKRNSVEGLSLAMFTIIFAANGSYAASLISMLPVAGPGFLHRSASYIYGPVGSIFIDVFVLIQFISLRKVRTSPSSSGSALP